MKRLSTLLGIALMGWFFVGHAGDYEVTDFGERLPTSREVVEALMPSPPLKVRGIVIHGNQQPHGFSQNTPYNLSQGDISPSKPKAVSMQVHFHFDSAKLTSDAKAKLDVLGSALNSTELVNYKFRVEGHTDSIGSATYNLKLSQRRAQSVAQYMRQYYHIRSDRIITVGKGMSEPANQADPKAPENRRVMIINLGSS